MPFWMQQGLMKNKAKLHIEHAEKSARRARAVRAPARVPSWVIPTVRGALVVADAALTIASFVGAFYLRESAAVLLRAPGGNLAWNVDFAPYGALLLFVLPIRLLTHAYYDLYLLRGEFSYVDDGVRIFKATAVASLLIVATAFLYRGGFEYRAFSYARSVFVFDFVFLLIIVALLRLVMRSAQTFVRSRHINLIPTLVVGRGPEASLFIREMRERPSLGYRVIGVVEITPSAPAASLSYEDVPVVGTLESLPDVIRDSGANEVIIADPQVNGDALFEV